jgi:hypothetical protein
MGRVLLAVGLFIAAGDQLAAQTSISRSLNNFTTAEDVELGRDAAAAVRSHLPPIEDAAVTRLVDDVSRRLTKGIPAEFARPNFQYAVTVLNIPDAMTVAFPGGPIFVGRQMIELADSEDALAGLIAHEIPHVALRHGTAQFSDGQAYQIGDITGRQLGLTVAAPFPGMIERGANFSVGSYFFGFDPAHEDEAREMGARMVSAARYDPDGLGSLVDTLVERGVVHGSLAWLARHPGMRTMGVPAAVPTPSPEFEAVRQRLFAIGAPPSATDSGRGRAPIGTIGAHVDSPAGEYRSVTAGDSMTLAVPINWRRMLSGNTVIFAPDGAFVSLADRPAAFTHGIQIGVARSINAAASGDAPALANALARNNPRLTWTPSYGRTRVAGRDAVTTTMSHVSPVTGQFETVTLIGLYLPDDSFLYVLAVAPQMDAGVYRGAFDRIIQSLRILDE